MPTVHYPAVSRTPIPVGRMRAQVSDTIDALRRRRMARDAGYPVHLTTDPAWLVDVAIDRRAGWAEDPHARVIVNAPRLGRNMTGDAERELRQIAHWINTPRLIVRAFGLGRWRRFLERRIPHRLTFPEQRPEQRS